MSKIKIDIAKKLLLEGGVVAIPTETVYGLAGWIGSKEGLEKIFSTKERPFFDPLIVHVDSIEKARELTSEWTEVHQILAESCWPGPLTLIAAKNDKIDSLITSGLLSVGLRCPDHPLTLELLASIPGGLAAPSANKFGKTSPTTALHVQHEFGEEMPILDGGACSIGIESTVAGVKMTTSGPVVEIYRPGFYTAQAMENILKDKKNSARVVYAESPVAPGQLKHHYMPKIPLVIIPAGESWSTVKAKTESALKRSFQKPAHWKQPTDASLASRELYQKMRDFDQQGYDLILVSKEANHHTEEWLGIWNRLEKAQSLTIQ